MDIEMFKKDIQKALLDNLQNGLNDFKIKRQAAYDKDKPLQNWQKDGFVLFRIQVRVNKNRLWFYARSYDWEYEGPESVDFVVELSQRYNVAELTEMQRQEIFNDLLSILEPTIFDDQEDIFANVIEIGLAFTDFYSDGVVSDNGLLEYSKIVEKENDGTWKQELHEYALKVKDHNDVHVGMNIWNIFWAVWAYEYNFEAKPTISFIEAFYESTEKSVLHASYEREETMWILETISKWLTARGGQYSFDELIFMDYVGDKIIGYAKNQNSVKYGKKIKRIVKENEGEMVNGSELDDVESDVELDEGEELFCQYNDENVVLKAVYYEEGREDYYEEGLESRGYVECEILNEKEEAYRAVLDFFIDIVERDFSPRFDFEFESELENYVELYNFKGNVILQDEHNQFWANCLQYPSLKEDMRKYVKMSAEKVENLSADEIEEDESLERRPDFFAAVALVMTDPTGYDFAECLCPYVGSIPLDQILTGAHYLADSYLDKYGVTDENVTNLVRAIESDPFTICCVIMDEYLDGFQKDKNIQAIQKLIEYSEKAGLEIDELAEKLED